MTWRPSFPKELQILIRLTTEQFSTLPQSILNEPWPRENACASGSCLDMASFLTYRVLAGNGLAISKHDPEAQAFSLGQGSFKMDCGKVENCSVVRRIKI